jgi:hypothetical protein
MATLTLGQASKLAGVGKTTLTRAINSGRLSAQRQADGSYRIDPAELSRVYEIRVETPATVSSAGDAVHHATPARDPSETPEIAALLAALEAEVKALREMLARADRQADDLRQERDGWRSQTETTTRLLTDGVWHVWMIVRAR